MTQHRIFVAGATGQVGDQIVRILLDQRHFARARPPITEHGSGSRRRGRNAAI